MFIDTSILIDIISHKRDSSTFQRILDIVKDQPMYISLIQLGEYSDWCYKNGKDPNEHLRKIKDIANVVTITEEICLEGSRIKDQQRKIGSKKFSLVDGIITATARSINSPILTKDNDFKTLEDAIVFDNFK
ncbi:MAG: type II toxin-antitoxin system VapC family toxin [Thermoplasmatota archaeon]